MEGRKGEKGAKESTRSYKERMMKAFYEEKDATDARKFSIKCFESSIAGSNLFDAVADWKKENVRERSPSAATGSDDPAPTIAFDRYYAFVKLYENKLDADEEVRSSFYAKLKSITDDYKHSYFDGDSSALSLSEERKMYAHDAYLSEARRVDLPKSSDFSNRKDFKRALRGYERATKFSTGEFPTAVGPYASTSSGEAPDRRERMVEALNFSGGLSEKSDNAIEAPSERAPGEFSFSEISFDRTERVRFAASLNEGLEESRTPWATFEDYDSGTIDRNALEWNLPVRFYWELILEWSHRRGSASKREDGDDEGEIEDVSDASGKSGSLRSESVHVKTTYAEWTVTWKDFFENFSSKDAYVTFEFVANPEGFRTVREYTFSEYVATLARTYFASATGGGDAAKMSPSTFYVLCYEFAIAQIKLRCEMDIAKATGGRKGGRKEEEGEKRVAPIDRSARIARLRTMRTSARYLIAKHGVLAGLIGKLYGYAKRGVDSVDGYGSNFIERYVDVGLSGGTVDAASKLFEELKATGVLVFRYRAAWESRRFEGILTTAKDYETFRTGGGKVIAPVERS